MEIIVKTELAVETVTKHYEAHQEEYILQLAGWQEKMKEYGDKLSEWAINGGKDGDRPDQPAKPQKFDREYKRLLKILDIHSQTSFKIDEDEFDQIFLNKFHWRSRFAHNSTLYGSLQGAPTASFDDDEFI